MDYTWIISIVSSFIGGFIAISGNLIIKIYEQRQKAKSLALTFRGELLALDDLIQSRHYKEVLLGLINDIGNKNVVYEQEGISITQNYFRVWETNCHNLGILTPEISEAIAKTYTFANSFIEDMKNPKINQYMQPNHAIFAINETIKILDHALDNGHEAIRLINKKYQ